ncbi:hypothetical protein AXF42_Ash006005 [Apostasia shenzhenica]|uniref:Uncharacterized protein n=1 Tax=Apostasia shenzhenica TaxID=1088818 RepID=A0A2I0AZZ9_9ASPA|nr:hypothetical protein AXF42_Ash006005 [Apostasia shenzhenica]
MEKPLHHGEASTMHEIQVRGKENLTMKLEKAVLSCFLFFILLSSYIKAKLIVNLRCLIKANFSIFGRELDEGISVQSRLIMLAKVSNNSVPLCYLLGKNEEINSSQKILDDPSNDDAILTVKVELIEGDADLKQQVFVCSSKLYMSSLPYRGMWR